MIESDAVDALHEEQLASSVWRRDVTGNSRLIWVAVNAVSVVWRGAQQTSLNLIQCMWKLYCVERRYARSNQTNLSDRGCCFCCVERGNWGPKFEFDTVHVEALLCGEEICQVKPD